MTWQYFSSLTVFFFLGGSGTWRHFCSWRYFLHWFSVSSSKKCCHFFWRLTKLLSIDGIISDIFHRRYGVTVFYFINGIFFLGDNGTWRHFVFTVTAFLQTVFFLLWRHFCWSSDGILFSSMVCPCDGIFQKWFSRRYFMWQGRYFSKCWRYFFEDVDGKSNSIRIRIE